MKKKLLVLTLSAVAAACAVIGLSACGPFDPPPPVHQHSFTAYDYDDEKHWNVCPDDNAIDQTSYRYHDFSNGDCICGKEGHKHVWSEDWTTDSSAHWHKCIGCDDYDRDTIGSHYAEKIPENAVFDETDHWYICETCGETFSQENHSPCLPAKDENGHWTSCWNCNYKIGYEEHDFSESDKCSCGYDLVGTDGLEYELVNGYFVVKSIGTATDKNIIIPSVYEGKEVLKIGDGAFKDCADILSVRIPESVNQIGANAFENCVALGSINLPKILQQIANTAFTGCTALESITMSGNENNYFACADGVLYSKSSSTGEVSAIHTVPLSVKGTVNVPDGVSSVTFQGRTGLQKVIFGEGSSLTKLGAYAFAECTALTEVVLPANLTEIGTNSFNKCSELTSVILPEKLTSIGQMAFGSCKKISGIEIPSSVTSIGNYAFASCSVLTDLTFGENIKIKQIGNSVFSSCTLLKGVIIPEGVTTIGQMAFLACRNLQSLTLPTTLTTIGNSAFQKCDKLTKLAIPDNVTSIGGSAFLDCAMIDELTFGANSKLATAGTLAFSGLTALTSVTLPDSLTALGNGMFMACSSLKEVILSENSNLQTVGNTAFKGCAALEYVVIPRLGVPSEENTYSIGNSVFDGCESLTEIYYFGSASDWAGLTINPNYSDLATDSRLCFYVAEEADLPADGGSYWRYVEGKPAKW